MIKCHTDRTRGKELQGQGTMNARERKQKKTQAAIEIMKNLYKGVMGNQISLSDRDLFEDPKAKHLTYGEIVATSFLRILDLAEFTAADQSLEFVDLGCGVGKPTICAALSSQKFSKCWGLDVVPALVQAACEVRNRLLDTLASTSSAEFSTSRSTSFTPHHYDTDCTENAVLDHEPNHSRLTEANRNGRTSEKLKSSKSVAVLSEPELITMIQTTLHERGRDRIILEDLVDLLCKKLGHKIYRNSIKPFGKFSKLIKRHPNIFDIDPATTMLILNSSMVECVSEAPSGSSPSSSTHNDDDFDTPVPDCRSCGVNSSGDQTGRQLTITREIAGLISPLPHIEFITGDIFVVEWWQTADVVYTASLLFSGDMMIALTALVRKMKRHTWFISLKPLVLEDSDADHIALRHETFFRMSWQMAKVYIYFRL